MIYVKPTTAISRVLRGLGLKQGHDFTVRGKYQGRGADRERVGTDALILTAAANELVTANADDIERLSAESGNNFRVSIRFTEGGATLASIANYGTRVREAASVADPYEGRTTRQFGSLVWACEYAADSWFFRRDSMSPTYTLRAYRGRVHVNGWYLSGPRMGGPSHSKYMGAGFLAAVAAAEDVILSHG